MPPPKKGGKAQPVTPAKVTGSQPKTPDPKATPGAKAPPPGIETPAIAKAISAGSGARPPAPAIPGQEAAMKAVAAADDSMAGSSSSAPGHNPPAAKKSNETKLKDLVLSINVQEVPENDVWLRLDQLTYAHDLEKAMINLMDTFKGRAHPLVDERTGRFDPEYTAIIDRYKVMTMLAYARVVRVSGDSPAMAGNLALTSSMLRHCMLHQAEQLQGGHRWVEYPILQMLGEKRIPSPLACWGKHLYGGSGGTASQKWHRTDIPIQSGAIDKLPAAELSNDKIDNGMARICSGFLQLRPTTRVIPGREGDEPISDARFVEGADRTPGR